MNKSETMLEYEKLTGEPSIETLIESYVGIETHHHKYIEWLEARIRENYDQY